MLFRSHRCYSGACPAVYRRLDSPNYVIVGKTQDAAAVGLGDKVGADETAIEISAEILEAALRYAMVSALMFPLATISSIARKFKFL